MEIKYNGIRLFLNLKKHYPDETQLSRNITINITLEIDHACIYANKLSETLDYAAFEVNLVSTLEKIEFELIEQVGIAIFNYIKSYSVIKNAEIEIIKKGILKYSESVALRMKMKHL